MHQSQESTSWSVEGMLQALESARQLDPQQQGVIAGTQPGGDEAITAVQMAKETLMAVGYNVPMRSKDRDKCA